MQPIRDFEGDLLDLWFSLSAKEKTGEFIDTYTAAQIASVSQRTILSWIDCGRIRALRVGKKYYIQTNSLKKFISLCTRNA